MYAYLAYLSIFGCTSIGIPAYLPIRVYFVCRSTYLSTYLRIYQSIHPSLYPSINQSVDKTIYRRIFQPFPYYISPPNILRTPPPLIPSPCHLTPLPPNSPPAHAPTPSSPKTLSKGIKRSSRVAPGRSTACQSSVRPNRQPPTPFSGHGKWNRTSEHGRGRRQGGAGESTGGSNGIRSRMERCCRLIMSCQGV